jgi:hypothetical protein
MLFLLTSIQNTKKRSVGRFQNFSMLDLVVSKVVTELERAKAGGKHSNHGDLKD